MAQDNATDLKRPLAQEQRQLSEALERQAATDEVLRIIASSPTDRFLARTAVSAAPVTLFNRKGPRVS
jgi:hypothetical protein